MVHCNRCDGYVSRDYARVFGDNDDRVTSCPNCRAGWVDEDSTDEPSERKMTFTMSEFDAENRSSGNEGDETAEAEPAAGRFGRVGAAVSGLF